MTSSRMSGSSSTTSTRLGMAPPSYQPGTGDAGSALGGLGSVEARSRGGQQPQQAQSLAQRVPVDAEHAGRLQLVSGRQLERQAQQRHLHARHHGPVQPPVTRRCNAPDDPREDGIQQPVELLHVDSALHARSFRDASPLKRVSPRSARTPPVDRKEASSPWEYGAKPMPLVPSNQINEFSGKVLEAEGEVPMT